MGKVWSKFLPHHGPWGGKIPWQGLQPAPVAGLDPLQRNGPYTNLRQGDRRIHVPKACLHQLTGFWEDFGVFGCYSTPFAEITKEIGFWLSTYLFLDIRLTQQLLCLLNLDLASKPQTRNHHQKIRMKAGYADECHCFWIAFQKSSSLLFDWHSTSSLPASQSDPQVANKSCHAVSVAFAVKILSHLGSGAAGAYRSHTIIPSCHSHTVYPSSPFASIWFDGWRTLWKTSSGNNILKKNKAKQKTPKHSKNLGTSWCHLSVMEPWINHLWGPRTLHLGPLKKSPQVP